MQTMLRNFEPVSSSRRSTPVTSRWVTSLTLDSLKGCRTTRYVDSTSLKFFQNEIRDSIWLRHACADHCRSLYGSRLSSRGSSERIEIDGRYDRCCSFETSTYGGSANFAFNNVSFESYAFATYQPHANSKCSSNAFDRARADESRHNRQASK